MLLSTQGNVFFVHPQTGLEARVGGGLGGGLSRGLQPRMRWPAARPTRVAQPLFPTLECVKGGQEVEKGGREAEFAEQG